MKKSHRRGIALSLALVFLAGCASQQSIPRHSPSEQDRPSALVRDTLAVDPPDSAAVSYDIVSDSTDALIDTANGESNGIVAKKLEQARMHYLQALHAQSTDDSLTTAAEFEKAISLLNELSNYEDIDANQDYRDLLRSVIEDYERYIASVDSLGPESSVFALREKLNQVVDSLDVSNVQVPATLPKTSVPLVINYSVEQHIAFFQGRGRHFMEHWLSESGKYFPMMKKIFKDHGVPEEMVYLSMMESGLNPKARSWAKAVGMWQFIKSTGGLYGLNVNWWRDERCDFMKATDAAARHLHDLYESYGDWYLVLCAYNAGPGWVNRGQRRSGSEDFWTMRKYLPRQTRNYVPQYIAVTLISLNPSQYGFDSTAVESSLTWDTVAVDGGIDLNSLAECAGTTLDSLQDLNPELLRWITPPGSQSYSLRIPVGRKHDFVRKYAAIPPDKRQNFAVHKIKRGETLSKIAKRYGVTIDIVREINRLPRGVRLRVGAVITIPVPNDGRDYASNVADETTPRRSKRLLVRRSAKEAQVTYRVKKGDTLGQIAEAYGVRISDLRNWNDIPYGSKIRSGASLTIYTRKNKTAPEQTARTSERTTQSHADASEKHTVKRGENLASIAADYGVSINDLRTWNNLPSTKIKIGQKLSVNGTAASKPAPPRAAALTRKRDEPAPRQQTAPAPASAPSVHVVKRGETLAGIADIYGVTVRVIQRLNRLRGSRIVEGQTLKVAAPQAVQPKAPVKKESTAKSKAAGKRYTVHRGESLWTISKKFKVPFDDLQSANKDLGRKIKPGDQITIPD